MDASDSLIATLPHARRLALAYAPADARVRMLALLALDVRLAGIVRNSHEPMLAQLRLAWWREQLQQDGSAWPTGEPLLAALRSWGGGHAALAVLADGWEGMAGAAPLAPAVFDRLAEARAAGFAALADGDAEGRRMGRNWALVDIAARLSHPEERAGVLDLAREADWRGASLPRALRPLAVLHGLSRRALHRGGNLDRIGPGDLLAALRIGLIGR